MIAKRTSKRSRTGISSMLGIAVIGAFWLPPANATWLDAIYVSFDTTLQTEAGVLSRQQILVKRYVASTQIGTWVCPNT